VDLVFLNYKDYNIISDIMFIDEAEITVKAGNGGSGKVSFFGSRGGPSGGYGGRGGNVYAVANANVNHLRKYIEKNSFKAEDGQNGGANRRSGAIGKNLELPMPPSTLIIDTKTNRELELTPENPRILLCSGGTGGLGNDAFKSSTNRSPRKFELGKPGQEKVFKLILKLIANYGLIGLPNAGKSSLLNLLTAAHAKVASYQFTTLEPNLGVIPNGKVLADIPGLIVGASQGRGLGIKFLKHIEKVELLLHCISSEVEDVKNAYTTINYELGQYNKNLLGKKTIILLTKTDLINKNEIYQKIKLLKALNPTVIPVSVYDQTSLKTLLSLLIKSV